MLENWLSKNEKNIKKRLFIGTMIICAIILLYCYICKALTGSVSFVGYKHYYIVSASMEPTIMTHQWITGYTIEPEDIKVGDIVSYQAKDKVVIHRVIAINNDGTFEFKGDNNKNQIPSDINVKPEQILFKIIKY